MYSVVLKVPVLLCEGVTVTVAAKRKVTHHPTLQVGRRTGVVTRVLFCYFGKKHTTELQLSSDGSSECVDTALFADSAVN